MEEVLLEVVCLSPDNLQMLSIATALFATAGCAESGPDAGLRKKCCLKLQASAHTTFT